MEKINTNSYRLYNDIRSLIANYDLPVINVSLILEKISMEIDRIVESELQREAQEENASSVFLDQEPEQQEEPTGVENSDE